MEIPARLGPVLAVVAGLLLGCSQIGHGSSTAVPSRVPTAARTARPATGPVLGGYFIQVKDLGKHRTDANGIPMIAYNGVLRYNPSVIAGEALGYFSDWISTGSDASWAVFLRDCDWLVANQSADGLWLYEFAYYGQPVPWWSAVAQGQALSALARAYQRTGDAAYQNAAARALQSFTRTQSNGGVVVVEEGDTWYEQYLPPRPPHTLNGFIFALIGVYEHHGVFGDQLSESIWAKGLATLKHALPRYDTGNWSCYSLVSPTSGGPSEAPATTTSGSAPVGSGSCRLASVMYQGIHVTQLRTLYEWTHDEVLGAYADRFGRYLESPPAGVSTTTPGP